MAFSAVSLTISARSTSVSALTASVSPGASRAEIDHSVTNCSTKSAAMDAPQPPRFPTLSATSSL